MIFEALQSELFRFKFHSLSSKILKIPEFSLLIRWRYNLFGYFNNFFNKSISVNFLIWILAITSEHLKFSFWNSHSREHCHDVIGFNIEVIIRFKLATINFLTFTINFMAFCTGKQHKYQLYNQLFHNRASSNRRIHQIQ